MDSFLFIWASSAVSEGWPSSFGAEMATLSVWSSLHPLMDAFSVLAVRISSRDQIWDWKKNRFVVHQTDSLFGRPKSESTRAKKRRINRDSKQQRLA
jgi:hypothetical protein